MRIGIYSGTFDPVHEGHILFAQVASEQFALDKVLLIPEPFPRAKFDHALAEHRVRMLQLATLDSEALQPFFIEGLASHTVNGVIGHIHEKYPDDEYLLVMGSDVYKNVGKWGESHSDDGSIKDIAASVGFIVGIENMAEVPIIDAITAENGLNTRVVEVPLPGMSSRKIRQKVHLNEKVTGVNDQVLDYIRTNKLYL
jgi:nicotinate-nucleotide adenylyltransferase